MRQLIFYFSFILILNPISYPQEQNLLQNLPVPGKGHWAKEEGIDQGGIKEALLIGVGRHASRTAQGRNWYLPCVDEDMAIMKNVLESKAGFKTFKVFKDNRATISNIKEYLTADLPSRIQNGNNLLIIYLSGHRVVQDHERCWFTHNTEIRNKRYDQVLESTTLSEWIDELKSKAASKSSGIKVCLVINSYINGEDALGEKPRDMVIGDELILAEAPGKNGSSSAFTGCFAEAMKNLDKTGSIRLKDVYQIARKNLSQKGLPLPERFPDKDNSIVFLDIRELSFSIRTYDQLLTPTREIKGAHVFHEDKELGVTPCKISGFRPGDYKLIIKKQGFLNSHTILKFRPEESGGVYEVPLLSAYIVLEGTVENGGEGAIPSGVTVDVQGEQTSFRDSLHSRSAKVGSDGWFTLLTPLALGIVKIEVNGMGDQYQEEFDLDLINPWYIKPTFRNLVPVYTLNPIMLRGKARMAESEMRMDKVNRTIYRESLSLAASGKTTDLANATEELVILMLMVSDEKTLGEIRRQVLEITTRAFRIYMMDGRYHEGVLLAKAALQGFPAGGTLEHWRNRFESEDIPADLRTRLDSAGMAVESGNLEKAENLYVGFLKEAPKLTAYYIDLAGKNLEAVRESLFIESYGRMSICGRQGDLEGAAKAFPVANRTCPPEKKPIMKIWEKRLLPYFDEEQPRLFIESPSGGSGTTDNPSFLLKGRASDNRNVEKVTVNNWRAELSGTDKEKTFSMKVELEEGKNSFLVEATDWRGYSDKKTVQVIFSKRLEIPGFTRLKKETFSCGGKTNTVEIYRHDKTMLDFVLVRGGTFQMGSPSGEPDREDNEGPQHSVDIKRFLMCRTEVTQGDWDKVMEKPFRSGSGDVSEDRSCALQLNWENCGSFCTKTGLRRPTEAEWEYACRAGTSTRFCFGDADSDLVDYAWYNNSISSNGAEDRARRVAQKKPNAFGLFDMHGNLWEWCQDRWHENYRGAPDDGSAWETGASEFRVIRGGMFGDTYKLNRSAKRNKRAADIPNAFSGFRPAFSVEPPEG